MTDDDIGARHPRQIEGLHLLQAGMTAEQSWLFLIGMAITLMTGRGVLFSGARQVLVGLAAAALTYGIGKLIGVSLG